MASHYLLEDKFVISFNLPSVLNIHNPYIIEIVTGKQGPLQHVPSLQGISKGVNDDGVQQLSARRQAANNTNNSSLAVSGKGNQM